MVEVFFSRFSTDLGILKGTSVSNAEDLFTAMGKRPPQYTTGFSYAMASAAASWCNDLVKLNAHTEQANGVAIA